MAPFMTRTVQTSDVISAANDELDGMNILLVEDQALIAMDTEEALLKLGAEKVFSVPNVAAAILTASDFDMAVLDQNLDGETSAPLADELRRRGVPVLFATGYGDSSTIPTRFGEVPVVRKPITLAELARKIGAALGPSPARKS